MGDKKILKHTSKRYDWKVYWRLLGYIKPYRGKLILGILCGFLAGGSMFGGLMMIPIMVRSVDNQISSSSSTDKKVEQVVKRLDEVKDPAEKKKIITKAFLGVEEKSKLALEVEKADHKLQKILPAGWNISLTTEKGDIVLHIFSKPFPFRLKMQQEK